MISELKELSKKDRVMKNLIETYGEVSIKGNYMESGGLLFVDLASSIASQQLSVKAATTIWGRVAKLLKGEISAENFLKVSDEDLRACGLSHPKIKYIKALSEEVERGRLDLGNLKNLDDEGVIAELTKVKGIGRWTAEMFLIFALNRPDVFSFGDMGLKNAILKHYGADLTLMQINAIVDNWKPYRSFACLLLWESLDNIPK